MIDFSVGYMALAAFTGWAQELPDCVSEDSLPVGACYWDASERGNGLGVDFIRDAQGNVYYVETKEKD